MQQLIQSFVAAALMLTCAAAAQQPVQWRVEDGGNGHWYALRARMGRTWTQAATACRAEGGHLATMTGPAERDFMVSVMAGNTCAIGGLQSPAGPQDEPASRWSWITGEPMSWTNWASWEPNNTDAYGAASEEVMGCFANGVWVDLADHLQWTGHYVAEWDLDCNGDGIVDHGQIRSGELSDANANGIADPCEVQVSIAVDGTADIAYGDPLRVQGIGTGFGDANLGQASYCNGSELDAAYARIDWVGGYLFLALAGNLESNYNNLVVFVDSKLGAGQNVLAGNNADVWFNGLNRMGDDGSGNGLRFDTDFTADYFASFQVGVGTVNGIPTPVSYYAWATLPSLGAGIGGFAGPGQVDASTGVLTVNDGNTLARVAVDNRNVAGVNGSNGGDSSGAGVRTGVEFRLSLAALGWNGHDPIKVCAFVSGGGFAFVSNQVLGPLPFGTQNLGEVRVLDFSAIAGLQHFVVPNTWQPDRDSDGVSDLSDNCPDVFNPSQADCDGDGIGNACDSGGDINGNGIPDDCECIADLYVDGLVNGVDLGALLAYWGPTTSSSASQRADLNRDGAVDGIDLGYLLSRWGPCGN